jgi:hypothetical protein
MKPIKKKSKKIQKYSLSDSPIIITKPDDTYYNNKKIESTPILIITG